MIESYCRPEIWKKCYDIAGKPYNDYIELLSLLPNASGVYGDFFKFTDRFNIVWFDRKRNANLSFRKSAGLMSRNGEKIAQAWIDECYGGSWENAMLQCKHFDIFINQFFEYFKQRREKFMEKTTDIIMQFQTDLKKIKQLRTNSHGGVANLLKVLTKTMNDQGAHITSIAKMQYYICTQAGVYLPDEFITDVLVAVDMNGEITESQSTD